MKNPLEGALYLFDKGLDVFPIRYNNKTPAVKNWQQWAETASREIIENYGRANPSHNWGVSCGHDLFILDLDNKEGKNGIDSFKDLLLSNNVVMPPTLTVETPTGGRHLYYKGEGKNSASLLGDGIDTRGRGGYVLCPGSRINNKVYAITDSKPIADFPEPLHVIFKNKKKKVID